MATLVQHLVTAFRAHHRTAPTDPLLVAELALWSATADGVIAPDEIADLAQLLQKLPGLAQFDATQAIALAQSLSARYATEDAIAARITELALAIHEPEARRASYRLAVWSAARDGQFSEEEAAFLENLQDCLEIDDDEADALVRAVIEA